MSDSNETMKLLEAETDFALALLRESTQKDSFVFSPLSIALALALVHAGAKGATKEEIGNALLKGAGDEDVQKKYLALAKALADSENGVEVNLANRMYIRNGFTVNQTYLATIKENFDAAALNLDFDEPEASAKIMNDFVEEVTNGKITDLVSGDSLKGAVAFLVNALYIKSNWQNQFDCDSTHEGEFFHAEEKTRKVQYMSASKVKRDYAENDEVQVLSLKYKDESYAFNIFLPKEQFGLDKFRAELTGEKIQKMLGELSSRLVNVKIPKMKIESDLKLVPSLKKIGIEDVFTGKADLSGIASGIMVSEVAHKAMIEVDEEGTTAAAASFVRARKKCGGHKKTFDFFADRPFFFALTKNQHPVFVGVYV